jgi:DNA-directed RNA polymerase subunit RPC12/RpoP
MNGFGNWLRQLGQRIRMALTRFMAGRYGTDKLNSVILWSGVIVVVVALFIPAPLPNLILHMLAYVLMGIAIFRTFSRQTYKRYQENRKFLILLDRFKDRDHRYYECPRCHQIVRVPRGKGKIAISCPKCGEKFIKKT